jgi:predicted nucleotidyltransferase
MGSESYGCSSGSSDTDVYGWCIPPREIVFPHLAGEIDGFGKKKPRFNVWQEHHIEDKESRKEYDFAIYSVVSFFQLCLENNPNMIDALFVPARCVLHCTQVANIMRENKRAFLHKGAWHKFKGYAYSQMTKMRNKRTAIVRWYDLCKESGMPTETTRDQLVDLLKESEAVIQGLSGEGTPRATAEFLRQMIQAYDAMIADGSPDSKRSQDILRYGFDVKFSYHIVRLLLEVEQMLTEGDLDLERNREQLKAIRRGEWTEEQIRDFFDKKERTLEEVYQKSSLPNKPNEELVRSLLVQILEQHYGSLDNAVRDMNADQKCLQEVREVLDRYGVK